MAYTDIDAVKHSSVMPVKFTRITDTLHAWHAEYLLPHAHVQGLKWLVYPSIVVHKKTAKSRYLGVLPSG